MAHHIFRNRHIIVNLPVMHLELEPDEIGQDGRAACLCLNRRSILARLGGGDGEPADRDDQEVSA